MKITVMLLGMMMLFLHGKGVAGETGISDGLNRLSNNLTEAYRKGGRTSEKARIAVLQFHADKELQKRRVGFAVSELLTHSLASKPEFTVIERLDLERVLGELKLNASGAIDTADAAKVGKLMSADMLVLGSVEKIGQSYHVNARMVRPETVEVISTAYEELPKDLFEEESKNYLLPPPELQRIGLYFLSNWRNNSNRLGWQDTGSGSFQPKSFNLSMFGAGVRYYPKKNWLLDLAVMNSGVRPIVGKETTTVPGWTPENNTSVQVSVIRGLLSAAMKPSKSLNCYIGGGVANYYLTGDAHANYYTAAFQGRLEYFPQARIGVSLSAGYELSNKTAIRAATPFTVAQKRAILGKFYIEPTISLYF